MNRPDAPTKKPKMAFFRSSIPGMPEFLKGHLTDQIACLRQSFDVNVVDYDCDYNEVCDRVQPEISVFESGVYAGRRPIRNVAHNSEVPKLGFLHADAFDASRIAFISDMANWGVETFFTTSVSMAEYTPEIADRLFVWPNFIDPTVFLDYVEHKTIPVLFTGSQARHYPWRNSICNVVSSAYPTMITPHFGWNGEKGSNRIVHGERYSRMINAATFSPTCGTITKDVVRKHFEIPGSRSCLITEKTASVLQAGFIDMKNCVFATEDDVLDKMDHLVAHPDELEKIVAAGYQLVHSRHTRSSRTQVAQWYELNRQRRPGQELLQESPFGPLELREPPGSHQSRQSIAISGRDRQLIGQGWDAIAAGNYERAETLFLRCMNYFFIPEAVVGLIWVDLLRGRANEARVWVERTLRLTLEYQYAIEPDPVQWACHLRVLLCLGEVREAREACNRYPDLFNVELNRMRDLISKILTGASFPMGDGLTQRPTVTPLPAQSDEEWLGTMHRMLRACGQDQAEWRLSLSTISPVQTEGHDAHTAAKRTHARPIGRRVRAQLGRADPRRSPLGDYLREKRAAWYKTAWSASLYEIASREALDGAFIIGGQRLKSRGQRGFLGGLRSNPYLPQVTFCADQIPASLLDPRGRIAVFVTKGASLAISDRIAVSEGIRLIVIEGTDRRLGSQLFNRFLDSGEYTLALDDTARSTGRAILRQFWSDSRSAL